MRLIQLPLLLLGLAAGVSAGPVAAQAPDPVRVELAQAANCESKSDLQCWSAVKGSKNAADYQTYLDKYPDGNFADLAKIRMKQYGAPPPAAAPAADDPQQTEIEFWKSIKNSKNAADYQAYLDKYPNGDFVDVAKLRVEQYGKPAATEAPAASAPAAAAPAEQQPVSAAPAEQPASATPAATPAAPEMSFVAMSQTVYAKNGGQVRAEPSGKAAMIAKLKTNTEVKATGVSSDGKWWRVTTADGQTGYMHASVVSEAPVVIQAAPKPAAAAPEPQATFAAPTGPDEDTCKPESGVSPSDRVSACERLVTKAGSDDTAKIAALNALAAALNLAHRNDESIRKYEQAAALAPRDPSIYYRMGLVRLDQFRFPEARAAFDKAASIDNKDSDFVFQRGVSYIGLGDFEKAKLEVERAILTPKDAATYYEKLGEINIARGDLGAAKVALERGAAADSGRKSLTLAAVNYFAGSLDTAASQASSALDDSRAGLWSAVIQKSKGDEGGAGSALAAGQSQFGDAWPGPVFAALSGQLDATKARAAARSKDSNLQFQQLCTLNFFLGEWAYLSGDKDAARAALQAALDTRAYWSLEYAAAKARLANMN